MGKEKTKNSRIFTQHIARGAFHNHVFIIVLQTNTLPTKETTAAVIQSVRALPTDMFFSSYCWAIVW